MTHWRLIFWFIPFLLAAAPQGSGQLQVEQKGPSLRLMLSEVQPGSMSAEHNCILVFDDRTFHAEKASRHVGRDQERKVFEGKISDVDWSTLDGILENDAVRKLNVPPGYMPLAVQNAHFLTISIRRAKGFQNMEFKDDSSRKPYDSELKPLVQWWKSVRGRHMTPSQAAANSQCKLDNSNAVVSY